MSAPTPIFTIGHSNHSLDAFVSLLQRHGITAVADVRSQPFSVRQPHFNREALAPALRERGIAYVFLGAELGGRPGQPSLYDADGRVDYRRVRTQDFFQRGLERLENAQGRYTVALLCSEENPLSCHRGLMIAPALAERGLPPTHVRGDGALESMAQMEQRLLAETGMDDGFLDGLFAATITDAERRELVAEAYQKMARKKSYRVKAEATGEGEVELGGDGDEE
ncbi:MAG: DUF488 domain-containing protein [Gemmataceae bacterium]|nr:DUF488 domain-containing protein [Gemmataceae bacterium]